MKIVSAEQMRQIDRQCAKNGLSTDVLMESAGKAVAEEVRNILGSLSGQTILILIGPGNNGGDGLVAGRYLHDWGASVYLYLLAQRKPDDNNFRLVKERGINYVEVSTDNGLAKLDELLSSATAVIDAIFGTGNNRPLGGIFAQALDKVSRAKNREPELKIIALDLPSGLNADTGAVDRACPYADYTITLGSPKLGLYNLPGAERAGKISVVDIGIPSNLADSITTELLTDEWAKSVLPKRKLISNKGSFGKVLVSAGSINYIGAAFLACTGAIRSGAGLVTLATSTTLQPILAAKLTETTYLPLPESEPGIISAEAAKILRSELNGYDVMLMGCGLGQRQPVVNFIKSTLFRLKQPVPKLVLDADALNTLAKTPEWWQRLPVDAILTPHPGEMARLAKMTIDEIQSDRAAVAKRLANEWHKTIVLKGAYTVIAAPDGRVRISPFANPGLASAGTGDVLSGVIAGLAAQGLELFDAASCGVYLHGKAGEVVKDTLGDTGMVASDLLWALPVTIKRLKEK